MLNDVVLDIEPEMPIAFIVYVPTGVEGKVLIVIVVEQAGLHAVGENDADAPAGNPDEE